MGDFGGVKPLGALAASSAIDQIIVILTVIVIRIITAPPFSTPTSILGRTSYTTNLGNNCAFCFGVLFFRIHPIGPIFCIHNLTLLPSSINLTFNIRKCQEVPGTEKT
jgi:hypothetical protein